MSTVAKIALFALAGLLATASLHRDPEAARPSGAAAATQRFAFPQHYREWIYLSSGFDMSYRPAAPVGHHAFDNVFVNPAAYKAFTATGTWPDKTVLVLEVREAEGRGSSNQSGHYQGGVVDVEVHVKDAARFPGKWAFYAFANGKTGKLLPTSADCYRCHAEHGAVDTTFVQFYPTLLPIARAKGTLAASYREETTAR